LSGTYQTRPLKAWPTVLLNLGDTSAAAAHYRFFSTSIDGRLCSVSQRLPNLFVSDHVGAANTLTRLIKMPATVTVFRRHRRTLYFLLGIISMIIMCIKIITKLECGPMPNVMVALPNTGGALCSTPQSLADAHY